MYYTDSNNFYILQLPWTKPVFFQLGLPVCWLPIRNLSPSLQVSQKIEKLQKFQNLASLVTINGAYQNQLNPPNFPAGKKLFTRGEDNVYPRWCQIQTTGGYSKFLGYL